MHFDLFGGGGDFSVLLRMNVGTTCNMKILKACHYEDNTLSVLNNQYPYSLPKLSNPA